jgi:HAE1 family hydrophobic/amphiphilic exporter-1
VIGGMLAASLLAIFFIPVSFDVIERFGNLFRKDKDLKPEEKTDSTSQETKI